MVATLAFLLVTPTQTMAIPAQSELSQEGLYEFSRFVGKYSVSTDGGHSGSNLQVEKESGATVIESAYLALVSKGSNGRDSCAPSATMTLSGEAVVSSRVVAGGVFSSSSNTTFCNYFAEVTDILRASLDALAAGSSVSFPILYDTSLFTGAALTAIFQNPTAEVGTVVYQFGHAPVTGSQSTINFAPLPSNPQAGSAILSLGIGWSIQDGPNTAGAEGFNTVRVGTSSSQSPLALTTFAGGYDDGTLADYSGLITVGGVGDSSANPTTWLNRFSDDELYDLSSFLKQGDSSLTIYSENASKNDTIFQLVLHLKSVASLQTVTFDSNGGTGSMAPQQAGSAAALSANTFTNDGFTFAGWNTAADGSGVTYSNQAQYSFASDITLFAQWSVGSPPLENEPVATEPAAYSGPIPVSLNPSPVSEDQVSQVTVSGRKLQGIYRATVDGKEIQILDAQPGTLSLVIPALKRGTYTLTYYSDSGVLYHQDALTVIPQTLPVQVDANPGAQKPALFAKKRFSRFAGDTTRPTGSVESIRAYLIGLGKVDRITCVGRTSGVPALPTDAALARERAVVACGVARKLFPKATISIRVAVGEGVGQFFRSVSVYTLSTK